MNTFNHDFRRSNQSCFGHNHNAETWLRNKRAQITGGNIGQPEAGMSRRHFLHGLGAAGLAAGVLTMFPAGARAQSAAPVAAPPFPPAAFAGQADPGF